MTVDHKRIGVMYIVFSLGFLVIGGIEAALIRLQLAVADNHLVSAHAFNVLFTMHGTTMVFLVGMPILAGFANYLVPLQIGARDVAFPRLNSFAFWVTCFGGLLLNSSFLTAPFGGAGAPDVGWFGYAPLTEPAYSRGNATDYWVIGLIIVGFGSIAGAVNIATTILTARTKGMTLGRMPLFTWITLVVQCMILVAVSPLTASLILLSAGPRVGGPLLRHPGRRLRRPLAALLLDLRAPRSLRAHAPGLRVPLRDHPGVLPQGDLRLPGDGGGDHRHRLHQRERMGSPHVRSRDVTGSKHVLRGLDRPRGHPDRYQAVQLARHDVGWTDPASRTPMLFAIAVLVQFLIAGITGVMLVGRSRSTGSSPTSYFVVAHFHFVLVGSLLFAIFGGATTGIPR